jgi:hypothetical protein
MERARRRVQGSEHSEAQVECANGKSTVRRFFLMRGIAQKRAANQVDQDERGSQSCDCDNPASTAELQRLARRIAALPLEQRSDLRELIRSLVAKSIPPKLTQFSLAAASPRALALAIFELHPRRRKAFDRALADLTDGGLAAVAERRK